MSIVTKKANDVQRTPKNSNHIKSLVVIINKSEFNLPWNINMALKKIKPNKFKLIPELITQDNRRFKRYGYFSMVKLLYNNWKNRNNTQYFYEDQGYWN